MSDDLREPYSPFDDDKLREECGIFGVIGVHDAANFVALGLHALPHRGQEAGGIIAHDAEAGFSSARRFGYGRDTFIDAAVLQTLPGFLGIGHVRCSTVGSKGHTAIRDVQPFFASFLWAPWAGRPSPTTATSPTPPRFAAN